MSEDTALQIEVGSQFTEGNGKPSNQYAFDRAFKEGLSIKLPLGTQLFIDLDSDADFAIFEKLLSIANDHVGVSDYVCSLSKSGYPHRHIVVNLKRQITVLERIALQACLGSDRKREILSFIEYLNGDAAPTLFFEKPKADNDSAVDSSMPF